MSKEHVKKSLFGSIFKPQPVANDTAAAEKSRLEAFLDAVPSQYCGWSNDGSIAYSAGFCDILNINSVTSIEDIKAAISLSDSAALEGLFTRLVENGISFTLTAHDHAEKRSFKITGQQGKDPYGNAIYNVLWLEDITQQHYAHNIFVEEQQLLHKELDRLQDSLDALPFPVWIRDEEQKLKWVNVAYAKKIDCKPSEIIAEQKELISSSRKKKPGEKEKSVFGQDLAKAALAEGSALTQKTHVVMSGERLWIKVTEIPLKLRQITVGIAEDLTEEEKLQTEITINQEANTALMEHLRSAIAIYNTEQRLSFYNPSFAQLWGLKDGWLNTKPKLGEIMEKLRELRKLPEQADFKTFKQSWLDMFTGLIEPFEDMMHLPDGTALRMLIVPHKTGGLMMTFDDVTSRLALESSYNTLVAVQKETLDNLDEGVVVYGSDGRLKLCNPSFGRLWNIKSENLEGEPHITKTTDRMKNFFSEQEWEAKKSLLIGLGLDRTENEGRFERTDKTLIDFSTVPLPDGGVLITFADVTDSVRVETALREKNTALQAAERLKLDFLANVSYQLRTPLNAIMGFNEILDRQYFGPLSDKQKEYTRDIHDASTRLLNLINDILDLSTIEAGQMNLEINEASISDTLQSVIDLMTDWARKGGVEIKPDYTSDIGFAQIDQPRIKQVILNLMRNAISHTPKGGTINVSAVRTAEHIEITITDSGEGIRPEDKERIMKPFERIENDAARERGAGLGLALVQNIIALHGGTFILDSEIGKGTKARFTLPLSQKSEKL